MFPNAEVMMLPLIVTDIRRAIAQNLDFVALPAALTLPDICAHADTGKDKIVREDYEKWCDEYVTPRFQMPDDMVGQDGVKAIPLTGQVIYDARCMVLHAGKPETNVTVKVTDKAGKRTFVPVLNDVLVFRISSKKRPFVHTSSMGNAGMCRVREIEIYQLCAVLTDAAMDYYESHFDKFKPCKVYDPDRFDDGGEQDA